MTLSFYAVYPQNNFLRGLQFCFFTLNQKLTGEILKPKWRRSINKLKKIPKIPCANKILRVQHTQKYFRDKNFDKTFSWQKFSPFSHNLLSNFS